MVWAAFHAVEVVSSSRFAHKRISYHVIAQSFSDKTPVLLLITNQLRKDLNSSNEYEVSLALECLARIGTDDLARDLTSEFFTLLGSSKAFVRKKSIGVFLRVFDKYPDVVKVCFKRLVENIESSDAQLLSAVVGVFYDDDDFVPMPMVLIDQDADPEATIVQLSFGDRLGALIDTVTLYSCSTGARDLYFFLLSMRALKDLGLDVIKGTVSIEGSVKQTKFSITKLNLLALVLQW
ncbi:hypothetical protein F2Q69_00020955 [Brassica cretica]|uniref:Clathrin/coatomer adaptor adaptin-like N-terminal domain-containing protein n=1 Tax=Brassica cretica TaxID=69181 RepID=A0A8S9QEU9_BRACR|nr:hypothetical protein F2Q69_00020955 [Brassica cretica]